MRRWAILLLILLSFSVKAQIMDLEEDENKFYAATKQVNQFFRRFNGEESVKGKRYYEGDRQFRSPNLRKKYLKILFNYEDRQLDESLVKDFIKEITDKRIPQFLDFHNGNWFAEVESDFIYKGNSEKVMLFLKLEQENLGYKWVIENVYFFPYDQVFIQDTSYTKKFLHPMSHELEFMNLRRVFSDPDSVQQYTAKDFQPDYLTLFLYEIEQGLLSFNKVAGLKFHFFQLNDWYFELSYFNREGYNTGWLISNLVRYKEGEKDLLMNYILYK